MDFIFLIEIFQVKDIKPKMNLFETKFKDFSINIYYLTNIPSSRLLEKIKDNVSDFEKRYLVHDNFILFQNNKSVNVLLNPIVKNCEHFVYHLSPDDCVPIGCFDTENDANDFIELYKMFYKELYEKDYNCHLLRLCNEDDIDQYYQEMEFN